LKGIKFIVTSSAFYQRRSFGNLSAKA